MPTIKQMVITELEGRSLTVAQLLFYLREKRPGLRRESLSPILTRMQSDKIVFLHLGLWSLVPLVVRGIQSNKS